MLFTLFLALTTIVIAASAAFFSVYGMAHIFAAAAIPIMIMGAALEVGKLMTASFLYRHWKGLGKLYKTYLCAAVVALMAITSLGIFGYLTAAYQTDSIPLKEIAHQIDADQSEKTRLINRNGEINEEIKNLKNNIVNGRIRLQDQRQPELDANSKRIKELDTDIASLQSKQLATEAHVGPIIFVAKALGREPDEAVFWFTLLIMSVFDPLAVALTIATNISINHRKEQKDPTRKLKASWSFEPIEDLIKAHGMDRQDELTAALTQALTESLAAEEAEKQEQFNHIPATTPIPADPIPPPPVTVTVTETIDKTQDVQDIVKNIVGDNIDADAKRRALLAAARK